MVVGNKALHIFKGFEALKDAVLKHRVELMLYACQHSILFVNVETELLEGLAPVQFVQVEQLEAMDDLAHASLYFRIVQELLIGKQVLLRHLAAS